MFNCLISLGNTSELILIENQVIKLAVSLPKEDLLTSIYKYLSPFKLDKIDLVVMPEIVTDYDSREDILIRKFSIGSINHYSVISRYDIEQIQKVIRELCIPTFLIHDKLSAYEYLGKAESKVILVGDYIRDSKILMYIDSTGIRNTKITNILDVDTLASYMRIYSVTNVLPMYNSRMNKVLEVTYSNFNNLKEEVKLMLAYTLLINICMQSTDYSSNVLSYTADIQQPDYNNIQQNNVNSNDIPVIKEIDRIQMPDNLQHQNQNMNNNYSNNNIQNPNVHMDDIIEDSSFSPRKNKVKKQKNPDKKGVSKKLKVALTVVGLTLAGLVGYAVVTNVVLPNNTQMVNNQISTEQASISNLSTVNKYVTLYVSDEQQGSATPNETLISNINSIKVNGLISELVVRHNQVGLQLLLKNESDINSYKSSLSKYVNISEVTNLGSVNVGKVKYYKFQLKGINKSI